MQLGDTFGKWLKARRKALDLTQAELADQIGCSVVGLQKIEADKRRPSKQIVERLADALAIAAEDRAAFVAFARRVESSTSSLQSGRQTVQPLAELAQAVQQAPSNLPAQPASASRYEDDDPQVRLLAALTALKDGDLSVRLPEGEPGVAGEIALTFNTFMEQISVLVSEIQRLSREVGKEGRLGGQAEVEGLTGAWAELRDDVNELEFSLTKQLRAIGLISELAVTEGKPRSISDLPPWLQNEIDHLGNNVTRLVRMISH